MDKEKASFLKRICAYLIDFIVVTLLASVIAMIFVDNKKYEAESTQLMNLTKAYASGEISKEDYTKQFDELNYYMTKDSMGVTIINGSVAIIYFVILCYFCHGITLGKYLLKLQITSANGKKLNIGNYLVRGLLVNMILSNIVSIILVLSLNKDSFMAIYPKFSNVLTIFMLATILFVMYRNDGRGLHDLASNTKVIDIKYNNNNTDSDVKDTNDDKITEAKVINEKKDNTKTSKSKTKQTPSENNKKKKGAK